VGFPEEDLRPAFETRPTAADLNDEELDSSESNVAAVLAMLPDDERLALTEWLFAGGDVGKDVGREIARNLGMPWSTFHRRLKSGLGHAAEAAAKYYTEHEAPEQYIEALAGVVPPEPVSRKVTVEQVLSVYRSVRSICKTADQLSLSREKVRRIVSAAA
jgi:DNA-binding transcriptional ArsR family regulator